jgi:hypothetical protein
MKYWKLWAMSALLAVLLSGGAAVGVQQTYSVQMTYLEEGWGFGHCTFRINPAGTLCAGLVHCLELGRFAVTWERRL